MRQVAHRGVDADRRLGALQAEERHRKPLRIGTLNAILREVAAAKGVAREDILPTP